LEDRVGGGGPCKRATAAVVVLNELVDSGDGVFDAAEAAAADRLLGNETEPALYLIEPGRVGGSVVHVKAGPLCEPEAHLGMLVSRVVVDDQMIVQLWGHRLVDALEKAEKLLMTVTRLALGKDRAAGNIKGGEQCCGAVADIVMGDAFHVPGPSAAPAGYDRAFESATFHRPKARRHDREDSDRVPPHRAPFRRRRDRWKA